MKRFIIILLFTCPVFVIGQVNLVPNPSFEIYDTCPNTVQQIVYAIPWTQPNAGGGSTDYYNACSSNFSSSVPLNSSGYQNANSGNAYAGFAFFFGDTNSYPDQGREYIEVELLTSLIAGKQYCVDFFVSLADHSSFAIDGIGALLTDTIISTNNYNNIYANNQVSYNNGIISDSINWTEISSSFIANGGEKYLYIGNFNHLGTFNYLQFQFTNNTAYYFVDDVSVYLCDSSDINTIIIPNVFTPNEDDVNDLFLLEHLPQGYEVIIYNRWGEIMQRFLHQTNESNNTWYWDGYTQAGLPCPDGVYFYVLKLPGRENRRGTVSLIR